MRIGVPKEIKDGETRVAVSPQGVARLCRRGHTVFVQTGAGQAIPWSDQEYRLAGARVVTTLEQIYQRAELICKVKEPQVAELPFLQPQHLLFTFLHLAGQPQLQHALQRVGLTAIAYETVQTEDGSLPLLQPMSQVAGQVAAVLGMNGLRADQGGKGILLAPLGGMPAQVVILGGGNVGLAAAQVLGAQGARVTLLERQKKRRDKIQQQFPEFHVVPATTIQIARWVPRADVLVGAVLLPGQRTPHLVSQALVKQMTPGSVIVDVAIDQGGCVATTRATRISQPHYVRYGVQHYAIPNLPALVPRTASTLLAGRVLPYLLLLADLGWEKACQQDKALAKGLNIRRGCFVYPLPN